MKQKKNTYTGGRKAVLTQIRSIFVLVFVLYYVTLYYSILYLSMPQLIYLIAVSTLVAHSKIQ